MLKFSFTIILFLLATICCFAYPIAQFSGTVARIVDRSIIINDYTFRPSGYAPFLPDWVKQGSEVTISYSCNELGECFYIDIVQVDDDLPIKEKINQNLLDFRRVFP